MRLLLGGLSLGLLIIILVTFYNFGSIPTDENVFVNIPSSLYISRPFTDLEASWSSGRKDRAGKPWQDYLRGGDFVTGVNGQKVDHLEKFREMLRNTPADSAVRLTVVRTAEDAKGELSIRRGDLPDSLVTELPAGAAVTQVIEGGASDRAGMHVGDVIVRINGQSFKDAQEADRILRRAQSGRAFTYEVLRGPSQLTLWVTLAQFGFPLAMLVLTLSGVVFLSIGAFIGLSKPDLKAARLLGLSYILLGFLIAIASIRREPDVTPFVAVRAILMLFSMYLGFATAWHSHVYFPRERTEILAHPGIARTMYAMAVAISLLLLWLGRAYQLLDGPIGLQILLAGILVIGLYAAGVKIAFRKQRSKLYGQQARVINITSLVVAIVTIPLTTWLIMTGRGELHGFVGLALVFIPLAHLYTIGRYRLLDMNLR
ncbi:MAG TPA: PDZ domain-containing protein, partial [Bacteroidota bacterium]